MKKVTQKKRGSGLFKVSSGSESRGCCRLSFRFTYLAFETDSRSIAEIIPSESHAFPFLPNDNPTQFKTVR